MRDWKKTLKRMKLESLKVKSPALFYASGGYESTLLPAYSDRSAEGLAKCIIDFLAVRGHSCRRIIVRGQMPTEKIQPLKIIRQQVNTTGRKAKFLDGSGKLVYPDLKAMINGRLVYIQLHVGHLALSDDHASEELIVEGSGELYFIARDMPAFITFHREHFKLVKS